MMMMMMMVMMITLLMMMWLMMNEEEEGGDGDDVAVQSFQNAYSGEANSVRTWEPAMIYFLEQNGYDVTCVRVMMMMMMTTTMVGMMMVRMMMAGTIRISTTTWTPIPRLAGGCSCRWGTMSTGRFCSGTFSR
jgi:hypothetical protein